MSKINLPTEVNLSKRAANYSKAELDCLLSFLEENPDLVSVRGGRTPDDIRLAWEEASNRIVAIGGYCGVERTGQEVKRKWADLKSRVKAKAVSLAIEKNSTLKLTALEERVLAIISRDVAEHNRSPISIQSNDTVPEVKVFSFHSESNSGNTESDFEDGERSQASNFDDSGTLVQEIKLSSKEDKKRRISETFSAERKSLPLKKLKLISEEEQLQLLCNSQQEINNEVRSLKEILKKCQLSIEKIALLKRAELRLKCAKYGVDFGDLFD